MLNETVGPRIHQLNERTGLESKLGDGLTKKWRILRVPPTQAKILAAALTILSFALDCYLPVPLNVAKLAKNAQRP